MIHRIFNELLRYHIEHGKAVFDNRIELLIKARGNIFRQRIAVVFLHSAVANLLESFVRAVNMRRIGAVGNRLYFLAHICDFIRVVDNNLFCSVSEPGEFLEHVLRSPEIERRLMIGIAEALHGHKDFSENRVILIDEMHIACSNNRLAEFIGESNQVFVNLFELLLAVKHRLVAVNQKAVVALGLNFNIVIKRGVFHQSLVRFTVEHGVIELTRLTGRADNQPVPVCHKLAQRNSRMAVEIFKS